MRYPSKQRFGNTSRQGKKFTREQKAKLRLRRRGSGFIGYRHKDESKLLMSEHSEGQLVSAETRTKISAAVKGKPRRWGLGPHPRMARPGNKHLLGKSWKVSPKVAEKSRQRMLEDYRSGKRTVHPNAGNGRTGFRADIRHFVRSTWEANVARILNLHNVEYEYECCSFPTSLGSYRPDFLLVELNVFLEVKGYDTPEHQTKRALANIPLILVGPEAYHLLEIRFREGIPKWE